MLAYEIIARKRDRHELTRDEIDFLIRGFVDGSIPDYQMAAFVMAVYLNGMTFQETANFTDAMKHSGDVFDFSDLQTFVVDKHSTGGVGDKLSLIIAPLAMAAGVTVPMIAGRGLMHSGGTLDKLEAIPGFKSRLNKDDFMSLVRNHGGAIAGQSDDLVPADRKLYSLRDVTATVSSLPLITSSIMSKKLAEGLNGLVMDVKYGSGAFMQTLDDARELAQTLVKVGEMQNVRVIAAITDMNQPLGRWIGNRMETVESLDLLKGGGPTDARDLSQVLAALMIHMGTKTSIENALALTETLLENGQALRRFREMIERQGGDLDQFETQADCPHGYHRETISADVSGFISAINGASLGMAIVNMGGGRRQMTDEVDPIPAVRINVKIGDKVKVGDPLAEVIIPDHMNADSIIDTLQNAIQISNAGQPVPLIAEIIGLRSSETQLIQQWVHDQAAIRIDEAANGS